MNERVAIIGAGPAGCAAAHAHRSRGAEVTLYERHEAIGGRTLTYRAHDDHVDTGAGFITNFYPRLWSLAAKLGFEDEIAQLHRVTGLVYEERLATLDVGSALSLLRFPFLSLMDKLKMAAWTGRLSLKRKAYDIASAASLVPLDTKSVDEYVVPKLGEALYHFLVRPGIEPFWYFRCEEISAALPVGLAAHAAGARFYYLRHGIDRICHHLTRDVAIETGAAIESITASGEKLIVHGQRGDQGFDEPFDRVIVATTATVANALTAGLPASLVTESQRDFLKSQAYVANVHISFRLPMLAEAPGVNAIFPTGPGREPIAALSFHYFKTDPERRKSHELISVFLATEESERVMDFTDDALAERAIELARGLFAPFPKDAEIYHISRRKEAIPLHAVGRYQRAADFLETQRRHASPLQFCGDYLATATVDGAIATGLATLPD